MHCVDFESVVEIADKLRADIRAPTCSHTHIQTQTHIRTHTQVCLGQVQHAMPPGALSAGRSGHTLGKPVNVWRRAGTCRLVHRCVRLPGPKGVKVCLCEEGGCESVRW
jgi:hypothetical protein